MPWVGTASLTSGVGFISSLTHRGSTFSCKTHVDVLKWNGVWLVKLRMTIQKLEITRLMRNSHVPLFSSFFLPSSMPHWLHLLKKMSKVLSGLKSKKFLGAATLGLGLYGGYQLYQSASQQNKYLRAEDARSKTNAPSKIRTRAEQLAEMKKFKEYDLLIIGTCLLDIQHGWNFCSILQEGEQRGLVLHLMQLLEVFLWL